MFSKLRLKSNEFTDFPNLVLKPVHFQGHLQDLRKQEHEQTLIACFKTNLKVMLNGKQKNLSLIIRPLNLEHGKHK